MTDKVVNVRMSEDCHAILKAYCAFIGKTMGDVMYDWTRQELHQQSLCCIPLQSLLDAHNKKLDHRAQKPCWGYRCNLCEHETACRCGKTEKLFILSKQWHAFVKPSCSYILEFNGFTYDRRELRPGKQNLTGNQESSLSTNNDIHKSIRATQIASSA